MKSNPFITFIALAAACLSGNAAATVVFDGGNPNQITGFYADRDYIWVEAATKFTLGSAITSNEVEWWGGYVVGASANDDDFILSVYAGGGSTPGTLLHTYHLGTGNPVATGNTISTTNPHAEYLYSAVISDLTLAAGTYFLSLSNTSTSAPWTWETTSGGSQLGGASYRDTGSWQSGSDLNLAFKLHYNAVPEPATLGLLGLGLAGLGFNRRRQGGNRARAK